MPWFSSTFSVHISTFFSRFMSSYLSSLLLTFLLRESRGKPWHLLGSVQISSLHCTSLLLLGPFLHELGDNCHRSVTLPQSPEVSIYQGILETFEDQPEYLKEEIYSLYANFVNIHNSQSIFWYN